MEPDRVNHVALHPDSVAVPRRWQLRSNINLAMILLLLIWRGRAQANDSAEFRASANARAYDNYAPRLDHFRLFKRAVEITNQYRPRCGMVVDSHLGARIARFRLNVDLAASLID